MKKIIKTSLTAVLCLILSVLIGTALLTAVFLIPTDGIKENLVSSAEVISQEGTYPDTPLTGRLDNFTDSIMLLEAGHDCSDSLLEHVMLVKRDIVSDKNPVDSLTAIYLEGETEHHPVTYERYWHGYLVFLKPLLTFMDYSAIRVLNAAVQIILILITVFLFVKRKYYNLIAPYLLAVLLLKPVGVFNSLQYSSCFYVMALSVIALLLLKSIKKHALYVFLFAGIATAYFDFLTYPLATYGIAAAIYFVITADTLKGKIIDFLKISIPWCFGYIGMWASKWILSIFFIERDTTTNLIKHLLMRSSLSADSESEYNLWNAFYKNVYEVIYNNVSSVFIGVFIIVSLIIMIVMYKRTGKFSLNHIRNIIPLLCIFAIPFMWYAVTINHSVVHFWFTNRELVVSAFAGMCLFAPIPRKTKLIRSK